MDQEKNAIEQSEELIRKALPDLIERALDLARGVRVLDPNEGEVYVRPPDARALMYLMDRVMGRPAQRVEMTGNMNLTPVIIPYLPREEAIEGTAQEVELLPDGGEDAGS